MRRERERLYAALLGGLTCALIVMTFLVPWYSIDYFLNETLEYRLEYSLGFEEYSGLVGMSRLMSVLTIILLIPLIASISAAILPLLGRTQSGAIIGAVSEGLLVASAIVFYAGAVGAGPLDHFCGYTQLNRFESVETSALIGLWVLVAAIVSQTVHVMFLAHLGLKKVKESDFSASLERRP